MHPGCKCSQSRTPPLPIINHRRAGNASERQASRKRPSLRSPRGSSGKQRWLVPCGGSSFSDCPPWGGPGGGGQSCTHCPFLQEGHLVLSAGVSACGWELLGYARGGSSEKELLPGRRHDLHLFAMRHKAFWSALEYTCRLLGISTAAGKSELSFSLALKGNERVLGPLSCLPAFGRVQPLPHPMRGTWKLVHFCFGTQGRRVLRAWPGSFQILREAQ